MRKKNLKLRVACGIVLPLVFYLGLYLHGARRMKNYRLLEELNRSYNVGESVRMEVFRGLLESGSNPNVRNESGWTPLMAANNVRNEIKREVVELLLAHGADPNAKCEYGYTALLLYQGNDIVQILLDAGADPNARDRLEGWTPLIHAVAFEQYETARLLCEHGARVNEHSQQKEIAAMRKNLAVIENYKSSHDSPVPGSLEDAGLRP